MITSNLIRSLGGRFHRLCFLFVLICCHFSLVQAQPLTGNYTIDPGQPSGETNFTSFNDAVAALDNGVVGPVIFDVESGIYTEQITINEISGAGPGTPITFQSQSGILCDVTLSYPTGLNDNWVVQLNGADYVTFRNICFEATGASVARVFYILSDTLSGANNNTIEGCQLTSIPVTSGSIFTAILYGTDPGSQKNDNNIFKNNTFIYGSYGVYFEGSSTNPSAGNEIKDNTFNDQFQKPIFLRFQDAPQIEGNKITNLNSNTGFRGVHLKDCTGAFTILKTQLNMNNGIGCWIEKCTSPMVLQGLIANNFFFTSGSSSDELILIENSHFQNVYYNSLLNTGNNADCLAITGNSTNVEVINNIIGHESSGKAYTVGSDTSVTNSDYNNFYTNGSILASWDGVNQSALADLQNANSMDANSSSTSVTFADAANGDLHLAGLSTGDFALLGTPLALVTDDIDGDSRDPSFPYMGADENVPNFLPVELTSFTAQVNNNKVILNWTTATETNNLGFEVQRSEAAEIWRKLSFIQGHGTTTEPQFYEFIDEEVRTGDYQYRLKQIDTDGAFTFSQVLSVNMNPPNEFSLSQNYPNPFNPETFIEYQLSTSSEVEITIYDALGRTIRALINETKTAGNYTAQWDGKNDSGELISSGIYYYTLKIGGKNLYSKKMLLLK